MCKPYFTKKHSKDDSDIVLIEKGETLLIKQENYRRMKRSL